jgi:transcriptional regulator with XRE-family HTH domain
VTLIEKRDQEEREALGDRIRQVREYFHLSQRGLANIIRITQSTVALFEKGHRPVKDLYIKMICNEYDVNYEWLSSGRGEMFPPETFEKYAQTENLFGIDREIVRTYLDLDQGVKLRVIGEFSRFWMDNNKKKILA